MAGFPGLALAYLSSELTTSIPTQLCLLHDNLHLLTSILALIVPLWELEKGYPSK